MHLLPTYNQRTRAGSWSQCPAIYLRDRGAVYKRTEHKPHGESASILIVIAAENLLDIFRGQGSIIHTSGKHKHHFWHLNKQLTLP